MQVKKTKKIVQLPSVNSNSDEEISSFNSQSDCDTIKEILGKIEKGEISSVFNNPQSPVKS